MNPHPLESTETARIARAASDWIVRCDRGLTAPEEAALAAWLAADVRHRQWLDLRRTAWDELSILEDLRPAMTAEPDPDLLAPAAAPASARRTARRRLFPVMLAAAAGLALVLTLRRPASPPPTPASCATRTLEDGTVVDLRSGATLETHFTSTERRVHLLSGEAHFQVTKSRQRPFIVETRGVALRDLGTEFDVRSGEQRVDLLVTEGRVSLSARFIPPVEVAAGQRTSVALDRSAPATVATVSPREMEQWLAWAPQLLEFSAEPLGQVAAEFNRRNRIHIVVTEPALARLPITASFRSDDPQGFARMLQLSAGIQVEERPDAIVLRPPAVAPRP